METLGESWREQSEVEEEPESMPRTVKQVYSQSRALP